MNDVYRSNDRKKKFCEFLRKHAVEIISFKKKIIKSLTKKEQQKSYQNAKNLFFIFFKKKLKIIMPKIKIRLGTIVIIQGNVEVLHIAYVI